MGGVGSGCLAKFDRDAAMEMYLSGKHPSAVGKRFGVSRAAIYSEMKRRGIKPRSFREAATISWNERGRDRVTVVKMFGRAWDQRRGTKDREESVAKRAAIRARTKQCTGRGELQVTAALKQRGLRPTHQLAIGRYNVDIALRDQRCIVELDLRGSSSGTSSLRPERMNRLFELGWSVFAVLGDVNPIPCVASLLCFLDRKPSDRAVFSAVHGSTGERVPRRLKRLCPSRRFEDF